jgi:DNA-binding NtrC family response regulator
MPHALLVDDDSAFQGALAEIVRQEGFTVETAGNLGQARDRIVSQAPDVALVDLELPDGTGFDLIPDLEQARSDIVLVTGHATVDAAVAALRTSVSDFFTKPVDVPRLKSILLNVQRRLELRGQVETLRTELRGLGRFGPLIGASPAMQQVYDLISRVAPTEATVLVHGESGTGKELVAQTVHQLSRRHRAPFVALNCGAVSPQLIESELFGHERGSFTGAARTHKGYFERAHGGTLFLDEITEMPIELQVRLLRALETGTIYRVGAEQEIRVDVRVISATNRDPKQSVAEGRLREDLLYRLSVFPISLPPLRERGDDVRLLGEHFLNELNTAEGTSKRFTRAALERVRTYRWPGNVRELQNSVRRAFILADEDVDANALRLSFDDTPGAIATTNTDGTVLQLRVGSSVAEAERRLILATLHEYEGDKERAARTLGISLKTLYNKLAKYRSS